MDTIHTENPVVAQIIQETKNQVIDMKNPELMNPISRIHMNFKRDQISKKANSRCI